MICVDILVNQRQQRMETGTIRWLELASPVDTPVWAKELPKTHQSIDDVYIRYILTADSQIDLQDSSHDKADDI